MVGSVSAAVYAQTVVRVHQALVFHHGGIPITLYVIRVTNKETKVFRVLFVERHIELPRIEKWFNVVHVKNLFMVPVTLRLIH